MPPSARIEHRIFLIRGKKVILNCDLAELYGVETKVLNQAVRRNIERFPEDFMFQMTSAELRNWKSQFVTSNSILMGMRKNPSVFTEQGIRTFTKLCEMIISNAELRKRLDEPEKKYDKRFQSVFHMMHRLLDEDVQQSTEIGFKTME